MAADQRLRETLEAFAARVREDLDTRAQNLAAELTRAVQESDTAVRAESDRMVAAERQQLEALLADERAALDGLKADLERTVAEERQVLEDRLADERAALGGLKTDLEQKLDEERRALDERLANEQAALGGLRAELERKIEEDRRALDERRATDEAAVADLQAAARQQQAALLDRLLEAVRRLDGATSLSGILEVLAQSALAESSRVVIFVAKGDMLSSWGHFGFPPGQGAFDVPVNAVRVLTSALSTQQPAVFRATDGEEDPSLPAFMRPPAGHVGLVAPLAVGGEVVAVLYADGAERRAGEGEQTQPGAWANEVELMARHARGRLENVTSERTMSALTRIA